MAKIDEYKDRMSAPIGVVRINPKTGKPIATKPTVKKTTKRK